MYHKASQQLAGANAAILRLLIGARNGRGEFQP